MARNTELLLVETVENLGIVGDIVKVKPGFARNYLRPLGMAEPPSPTVWSLGLATMASDPDAAQSTCSIRFPPGRDRRFARSRRTASASMGVTAL